MSWGDRREQACVPVNICEDIFQKMVFLTERILFHQPVYVHPSTENLTLLCEIQMNICDVAHYVLPSVCDSSSLHCQTPSIRETYIECNVTVFRHWITISTLLPICTL